MRLKAFWHMNLSHVKHGDILIGTIAASMAGIITTLSHWGMFFGGGDRDRNSSSSAIVGLAMMILAPLAAGIIQMAVSRSREYMADKSGGELSGNPDALADALLKIESYAKNRTMPGATENTAHMFIICPLAQKICSSYSVHIPVPQTVWHGYARRPKLCAAVEVRNNWIKN